MSKYPDRTVGEDKVLSMARQYARCKLHKCQLDSSGDILRLGSGAKRMEEYFRDQVLFAAEDMLLMDALEGSEQGEAK